MQDTPADRLAAARHAAGYENPTAFARRHKLNENTYRSHENGVRKMSKGSAEIYAQLLGTTAGWLLFGEKGAAETAAPGMKAVPIIGEVAAGLWREHDETDDARHPPFAFFSDRYQESDLFGFRVQGDSMDLARIYDGSIIICVAAERAWPSSGDVVVIERTKLDGTIERTCKRYIEREREVLLRPESSNPRWQPITVQRQANDGFMEPNGIVVTVRGRVLMAAIDL